MITTGFSSCIYNNTLSQAPLFTKHIINDTMDPPREVNKDPNPVTTEKKIEDLYNLIRGIGFCMMTTVCKDTGGLVSRAMSPRAVSSFSYNTSLFALLIGEKINQVVTFHLSTKQYHKPEAADAPADLWFFVNATSPKIKDIEANPNVNLAFHKQSTSEWISVSGKAEIVHDRSKIKQLYSVDLKPWFGDLHDGTHDGGPDDPRIALIFVTAESVHYSLKDTAAPLQIWRITKGMITGEAPKVSAERSLEEDELHHGRNIRKMGDSVVE
ncbi:hypothetical protein BDB00DRAFT_813450 [Zychaea mexicana]|uniref:uncharacterized protein n=1 Tax=Zychaea mexicana TaxID=64656 RepID=UPI0022FEE92E|nr:uncharacterized protein BDB00DRAFT_813450 [Zychaea mexicana]KAI9495463.1 hypothetical protein BDB00DRAFT_813450 [Zychaea mexicana]